LEIRNKHIIEKKDKYIQIVGFGEGLEAQSKIIG
jgi:hypothetical protein